MTAVLARQLIDTPLQGLAQTKVIPAERQHGFRHHRPKKPLSQSDPHRNHPPTPRLALNLPSLNQAKAGGFLDLGRSDVGGDTRPSQPLESFNKTAITIA